MCHVIILKIFHDAQIQINSTLKEEKKKGLCSMTHINLVANFTAEIQFNCQLKAKIKISHFIFRHTKSKEGKKIFFFLFYSKSDGPGGLGGLKPRRSGPSQSGPLSPQYINK
jgi:hypothetical protein